MTEPFQPFAYPNNLRCADAHALMHKLRGRGGWPMFEVSGWSLDPTGGFLSVSPNWLRAMLDPAIKHVPGWRAEDEVKALALWLGESGIALERTSMGEHVYRVIPVPATVHEKPIRRRDGRAGTIPSGPLALSQALIPGPLSTPVVDILIARLNALVYDETFAADVLRLMGSRVACLADLTQPRLRAVQTTNADMLGFLGLLNGIVGDSPAGRIASVVEDGRLIGFRRVSTWTIEQADADPFVSSVVGGIVADWAREDYDAVDRREAEWVHPMCPWSLVMELAGRLSLRVPDAGSCA